MKRNIKKTIISLIALNLILSGSLNVNNLNKNTNLVLNIKATQSNPQAIKHDVIFYGDTIIYINLSEDHTNIKKIHVCHTDMSGEQKLSLKIRIW